MLPMSVLDRASDRTSIKDAHAVIAQKLHTLDYNKIWSAKDLDAVKTSHTLMKIVPSGDFESIETIDFVSSYVQKEWTDYHVEHNFRIYIEEMERGQGQAQRGANTNDVTAVEVCRMSTELRQKLKQVEAEEAAHMAVLIGKTTCPEGVDAALFAPLPRHVPQWTGSPSAAEQNVAWGVP